jgi:hypothetical protein
LARGGKAFGFFEDANKIVLVVEAALEAYLADGILFVGEELAGQADADQEFFQAEVGVDILRAFVGRA